jgi:colanic acid/amylovoran biosynthesis glycosyltransferase
MRIAIVVNRFPTLSETFIFNKVKGLAEQGADVTVIVHDRSNDADAYQEDWNALSTKVKVVKAFNKRDVFSVRLWGMVLVNFLRSLKFLRDSSVKKKRNRLRDYLLWLRLSNGFDIIHFEYTGLAITYLEVIPDLKPAKIFVSCRGAAEQIKPLTSKSRSQELAQLFQIVDRVHCVSGDMLKTCTTLYGLNKNKAFVNRPAINVETFTRSSKPTDRLPSSPFLICSTGRLHWKKGFEYALLAMKELKQRGFLFKYEIIGGGIELEKLIFMAHDLGLQDHIIFSGSLPGREVKARLEKCDIYLLPSLSEGISNSVLEAMAMQLPVVTTRAGGMDEVIKDNDTGLIVDGYDAGALADALATLMENVSLRVRLASAGNALVRSDFTTHRQINFFVEQYKQALHA